MSGRQRARSFGLPPGVVGGGGWLRVDERFRLSQSLPGGSLYREPVYDGRVYCVGDAAEKDKVERTAANAHAEGEYAALDIRRAVRLFVTQSGFQELVVESLSGLVYGHMSANASADAGTPLAEQTLDTLTELKDKAEVSLSKARKAEMEAKKQDVFRCRTSRFCRTLPLVLRVR